MVFGVGRGGGGGMRRRGRRYSSSPLSLPFIIISSRGRIGVRNHDLLLPLRFLSFISLGIITSRSSSLVLLEHHGGWLYHDLLRDVLVALQSWRAGPAHDACCCSLSRCHSGH